MRNPYTGVEMTHARPPGRLDIDYAFLGILGVGITGVLAHVLFRGTAAPALAVSTAMVTILYLEIGGYGWGRARDHRLRGHPGANHDLAIAAAMVGAWDLVSPHLLGDTSSVAIALHTTTGACVMALAGIVLMRTPVDTEESTSAPQP